MASTSAAPPRLQFSIDKKHSDPERWICIYPAYINSKKTLAQGRRIPKEKCVENPTFQEMRDVLNAGSFKFCVENKLYSRERSKELAFVGRVRVQIKDDNGAALKPDFQSRESVMLHLCEMIPALKTRQNKGAREQQQSSATGGKGKGKKGKR